MSKSWNKIPTALLATLCQKACSKTTEHAEFAQVCRTFHTAALQPTSWPSQWVFSNVVKEETLVGQETNSTIAVGHEWSDVKKPVAWTQVQWRGFKGAIKFVRIQDIRFDIESLHLLDLMIPIFYWKHLESLTCTTLSEQLVQCLEKGSCPKLKEFNFQQHPEYYRTGQIDTITPLKRILLACELQWKELDLDIHPLFPTWTQNWESVPKLMNATDLKSIPKLKNVTKLDANVIAFGDVDAKSLFHLQHCLSLRDVRFTNCIFLSQECYPCQLAQLEILVDEEEHFQSANSIIPLILCNNKTLANLTIDIEITEERESSTCNVENLWNAIFQCTRLKYLNIVDYRVASNLKDLQKLINLKEFHLQTSEDLYQVDVELPRSLNKITLHFDSREEYFTLHAFCQALTRRWCLHQIILDELKLIVYLNSTHLPLLATIRVRKLKLCLIKTYHNEQLLQYDSTKLDNACLEEINLEFQHFNMCMALNYLKLHFPVLKRLHIRIIISKNLKEVDKELFKQVFEKKRFPCLEYIYLDDKLNLLSELDRIFECKIIKSD